MESDSGAGPGSDEVEVPELGIAITRQVFGALSQRSGDPLSRVSIANSSFSLDPYRGCPLKCAYCTVGGAARDIDFIRNDEGEITGVRLPSTPQRLFSAGELVDSLLSHPGFIRDRSVVSVATASSEPFLPQTESTTWEILRELYDRGCTNPIWLVAKSGIPDRFAHRWAERVSLLRSSGIGAVVSVSYSAAPSWVEPFRGDRFRNMQAMRDAGVCISHHFRPVIRGINDSVESIKQALSSSLGVADAICIGGLRRDPGVEVAWRLVYGLDERLLPQQSGRVKELRPDFKTDVLEFLDMHSSNAQVFETSSETIAHLLGLPDYNLTRYRSEVPGVFLEIPAPDQTEVIVQCGRSVIEVVESLAGQIGIEPLHPSLEGGLLRPARRLSFREATLLRHALGHSGVLP